MIKTEDHNAVVSDCIKKFLMKNHIKNFKKRPYQEHEKPHQESKRRCLIKEPNQEHKNLPYKNLIKNPKNGA